MKRQDSRIINLMGRQRMLSQEIEVEFYKIAINKPNVGALVKYFNEWKTAHELILLDSLEINKCFSEAEKSFASAKVWPFLRAKISFIGDEIERYQKTGLISLDAVDENQGRFLVEMDRVVARYVTYSDEKLNHVIVLEIILACLSILVIFLEVRFIYYTLAKELEDSLEVVQSKNKDLNHFNYIASHDLKEPLRTVSNYVQIIEEDFSEQLPAEAKRHLGTIDRATKRMALLINLLLDFSRLGKNTSALVIDCNVLVKDVAGDLFNLIEVNKARVTFAGLPTLVAYETELRQLFQNLISNAIKFKREGVFPEIDIGCVSYKDVYEFYVKDNGIGIERKYFERIFQMFQRLSTEKNTEGHGIGLANCKRIVEIHGGRIWVESEPGKGSTFKFTLSKNIK